MSRQYVEIDVYDHGDRQRTTFLQIGKDVETNKVFIIINDSTTKLKAFINLDFVSYDNIHDGIVSTLKNINEHLLFLAITKHFDSSYSEIYDFLNSAYRYILLAEKTGEEVTHSQIDNLNIHIGKYNAIFNKLLVETYPEANFQKIEK